MRHIVLIGDSIFDNAIYVPGEACLADQLRAELEPADRVSLLAIDGSFSSDIREQAKRIPRDATHVVVSAGGNDALASKSLLSGITPVVEESLEELHPPQFAVGRHRGPDFKALLKVIGQADNILTILAVVQQEFRLSYRKLLEAVAARDLPFMTCTIYDAIPHAEAWQRTALAVFNDVILREAIARGSPVLDLRELCNEETDYSKLSPIEPSAKGGLKIAKAIKLALDAEAFGSGRTTIFR